MVDDTAKSFNIPQGISSIVGGGGTRAYWILDDTTPKLSQTLTFGGDIAQLTEVQVYAEKIGSPGDLIVEVYKTKPASESATTTSENKSTRYSVAVYDDIWVAERFSVAAGNLKDWWFYMAKAGSPPDLVLEVREDDGTGGAPGSVVIDSQVIPASRIETTRAWHHLLDYNPPLQLTSNTYYWVVAHTLNNGGDGNNYYKIYGKRGLGRKSTDGGVTWGVLGAYFYGLGNNLSQVVGDSSAVIPDESALLTDGVIPSSSVSTPAYYTAQLKTPIVLKNGDKIAVVIRTASADFNNYYKIYHSLYDSTEYSARFQTDWRAYKSSIAVQGRGYRYATLYQGSYYYRRQPGGSTGRVEVQAYANTGTINIYLFIEGRLSAPASTSSTSPAVLTITDDPVVDREGDLEWRILADGDGKADYGKFQPRIKYDKNPVYPRDFGFSETYLLQIKAEAPDTLIRLNDKTSIYLANAGDVFQVGEAFRTPVKKLQVLSGQATADLLGVE